MINICICVNEKYFHLLNPLLYSLKLNMKSEYKVNLIMDEYKKIYAKFIKDNELYQECNIHINNNNNSILKGIMPKGKVKSLMQYYRWFIPELFPNEEKVIYVDADCIVNYDLTELYNIDIGNNIIGACRDFFNQDLQQSIIHQGQPIYTYDFTYPSYLSGLLLINVKKWNKYNITNQLIEFIKLNNTCDIIAMSWVLKNDIFELDKTWINPTNKDINMQKKYEHDIEKAKIFHIKWWETKNNLKYYEKYLI